jgi:hypothetical protein
MATVVFKTPETIVQTGPSTSTPTIRKPFFVKVKENGQRVINILIVSPQMETVKTETDKIFKRIQEI